MNLEMVFRCVDVGGSGSIHINDLKALLIRMDLGLDEGQVARVLTIFDQNCSGTIEKSDWLNCLAT